LLSVLTALPLHGQVIIKDTVVISPGPAPASPQSQLIWETPEWGRLRIWFCSYRSPFLCSVGIRRVVLDLPVDSTLACELCGYLAYGSTWEPSRGWPAGTPVSVLVDSYGIRYPDSITVGSYPGTIIRAKFWFTVGPSNHWIDVDLLDGPTCSPPTVSITHPAQDTTIVLSVSNQPTITFQETHTPAGGDDCEPIISWEPNDTLHTSEYWSQIADSIQIPVIVTARNQYTARDTVRVTLRVEPSVKIFPANALEMDGEMNLDYELQISPASDSGSSFLWDWRAKNTPAGNNPFLRYLPDSVQQNVTVQKANWYAFPDDSCLCSRSSTYILQAQTVIHSVVYTDSTHLSVYLPDTFGVTRTVLAGEPTYAPVLNASGDTIKWKVESRQGLTRTVEFVVNVLPTSQFYHKVAAHESVHVYQRTSGMTKHLLSIDTLWNRISTKEMPTRAKLDSLVKKIMNDYVNDENKKKKKIERAIEQEAYAVSDPIPPRYFQFCPEFRFRE
jgi:hypothetical protein